MKIKDPTSAACVFLLFLLLPPVSPKCQNGTADECKKAEFVPGGKFASKGFDINRLVSRRYVYQEITKDGECTLCENPLLEGKPLQRLPLIITDWKANILCQEKVQHSVHQSPISVAKALTELLVKNDWRNELDVKISLRDKFQWALAGSRSEITQECIEKSSKDKYIFLLHHFNCSYYKNWAYSEDEEHEASLPKVEGGASVENMDLWHDSAASPPGADGGFWSLEAHFGGNYGDCWFDAHTTGDGDKLLKLNKYLFFMAAVPDPKFHFRWLCQISNPEEDTSQIVSPMSDYFLFVAATGEILKAAAMRLSSRKASWPAGARRLVTGHPMANLEVIAALGSSWGDQQSTIQQALRFRVNKQVSTYFTDELKFLPENYDPSSKMEYFALIRSYGTHFETEFDLGVHVSLVTPIPMCVAVLEGLSIAQLSLCLAVDVGISVGLDGLTKSSDFQLCKEKKKQHTNFFLGLSGSSMEISGGRIPSTSPKEWLESAKSRPSLLFFFLEPLHTMVNKTDPRREGLRQAVSEYVRENTLWRNCTHSCPAGSWLSTSVFCSCECPDNNFTTSTCCAPKRGLAKLTVTIERAERLWGDRITRSDGYVSVSFKKRWKCTHTVWNNNSPSWNVTLDFGVIQLDKDFNKLEVEVWDQDFGWNDNLLGRCKLTAEPGTHESKTCYLNDGQMYFKYRLVCGHNLVGSSCWDYFELWPYTDPYHDYYHY
ncbi:perforin-1-like [Tiliqua scincoides]|uniref:perforin-1-like n=1 Tax=Tiliqua scincoides TaxID=71010 RepID=UPI003463027A